VPFDTASATSPKATMHLSWLSDGIGIATAAGIRKWVRLTGRRVAKVTAPWLQCPMGPPGRIGAEFYELLAKRENLRIQPSPDEGLLPSFDALTGKNFNPASVHPAIRDFYEHTSCYRLEAWSEAGAWTRAFLWALTRFVSRRMDQLNFPVSSLELAGGMSSSILPMVEVTSGRRLYTGWLRRLSLSGLVIYTGLYSVEKPAAFPDPCVKVSFPLPYGSATVFLRPESQPDGSFKLVSSGSGFGEPGFYRMVEVDPEHWKVRYIKTLREYFHVYVDQEGTLRTEHTVRFLGFRVLRLIYKMDRVLPGREAASPSPPGSGAGGA
jgi:hypothetical protein